MRKMSLDDAFVLVSLVATLVSLVFLHWWAIAPIALFVTMYALSMQRSDQFQSGAEYIAGRRGAAAIAATIINAVVGMYSMYKVSIPGPELYQTLVHVLIALALFAQSAIAAVLADRWYPVTTDYLRRKL